MEQGVSLYYNLLRGIIFKKFLQIYLQKKTKRFVDWFITCEKFSKSDEYD